MNTEITVQGTRGNDQGTAENHAGTRGNDQGTAGKDKQVPEIVQMLGKRPELRRELIKWVRSEFGFNIESILENYFGEMPDKKYKIEELDVPLREIAEDVLLYQDDGWSVTQIASQLGIHASQVSKILRARGKWEKEISAAANKAIQKNIKLPWYLRLAARLRGLI